MAQQSNVIPAQAGILDFASARMDSRLHGNDMDTYPLKMSTYLLEIIIRLSYKSIIK